MTLDLVLINGSCNDSLETSNYMIADDRNNFNSRSDVQKYQDIEHE